MRHYSSIRSSRHRGWAMSLSDWRRRPFDDRADRDASDLEPDIRWFGRYQRPEHLLFLRGAMVNVAIHLRFCPATEYFFY